MKQELSVVVGLMGFLILIATIFILFWVEKLKRKVLAYWFVFTAGLTGYCLEEFFCTCCQRYRSSQPFSIRLPCGFGLPILFARPAGGRLQVQHM